MGGRPFVAEAVLEAAFDLFAERGVEAVTSREVAAAAGVGHASMYRHFPSMQELGQRVWERGCCQIEDDFRALEARALAPRRALRESMHLLYDSYDHRPRALALLVFPPHDITPAPVDPANPQSVRRIAQRLWQLDDDRAALLWGAITGPIQDRYLRRRADSLGPLADEHAQLLKDLVPARRQRGEAS